MRYFSYLHKSWHAGVVTLLGMMLYSRQGLSNTHTLASILFEKRGWGLSHIFPAQRGKQTLFFPIHSKRAFLWPFLSHFNGHFVDIKRSQHWFSLAFISNSALVLDSLKWSDKKVLLCQHNKNHKFPFLPNGISSIVAPQMIRLC